MNKKDAEKLAADLINATVLYNQLRHTLGDHDRFTERERTREKVIAALTTEDKPAPRVVLTKDEVSGGLAQIRSGCSTTDYWMAAIPHSHERLRELGGILLYCYNADRGAGVPVGHIKELREIHQAFQEQG